MKFRIVSLPPFKAISSGLDKNFDFSGNGILGKFDKYFSSIKLSERDSFIPRDFLYFDKDREGLIWWWALTENEYNGEYETIDFEGGYYLTYTYKDGDENENARLYNEAIEYIALSVNFEIDIRPNHYPMGHIITPSEIIKIQKWAQMETYIPIKIKI